MTKISRRGGFSDRNAIKPENTEIQIKDFDMRTRIQLLNLISRLYVTVFDNDVRRSRDNIQDYLIYIKGTVYSEPIDAREYCDDDEVINKINNTIINDEYDDVLTLIEAIAQYWDSYLRRHQGYQYYNSHTKKYNKQSVYEAFNATFEKEFMGYRFVDSIIVPISNPFEVRAINEVLANKYEPVHEHIAKANKLLSDRDKPDYENSIKESISAVEAMCSIMTGIKGKEASVGKMLKKMEDSGIQIHGSLKTAFSSLYGYASDANGIRHAGDIGGPEATFEEAKFMLVSCCAFINYLTGICAD